MVTYSKELKLDPREFEYLMKGVHRIECDLRRPETEFIVLLGGRLGLRPGEICHFREDWVNWRKRCIEIPMHDACDQGKDGGLCGSCRQSVRQRVEYHDMTLGEARMEVLRKELIDQIALPGHVRNQLTAAHLGHIHGDLDDDVLSDQLDHMLASAEEIDNGEQVLDALDALAEEYRDENELEPADAEQLMWSPKTENASRDVYFDWCPRAELILETYTDRFDRWMNSQTCINRRLDTALELAPELDTDTTTPHGLRATAASYLSGRGLSTKALQAHFGWSQASTAERYVENSPEATHSQLLQTRVR
ncbi:hypothetical protein DJ84_18360 [Halorubrum ezzemoulense]|nr:hypothetical protein DJ84_18360 [Halorubrum ezzemoulense]